MGESTAQLNSNGNRRGMHPNSRKNLEKRVSWLKGQSGNPQGQSLVVRFREKLLETCPFDSSGRTWFDALSEAAMRQALTQPIAMRELLDRLEGKVTQPISGDQENPVLIGLLSRLRSRQEPPLITEGEDGTDG